MVNTLNIDHGFFNIKGSLAVKKASQIFFHHQFLIKREKKK